MALPNKVREVLGDDEVLQEGAMDEVVTSAPALHGRRMWGVRNLAIVGFLVVVAGVGAWTYFGGSSDGLLGSASAYQAVFLDNNQVYFGKLTNMASTYPVLKDIYYLRVTQRLQPPAEGGEAVPDINLVKLGTELHGPADEMKINREHILFIEDLKPDSEVTKAIDSFKAAQK